MRNIIIVVALIGCPEWALAQDKWFASDKMKHFGGGAAISGGAYAVAVPVTKRRGWRVAIGTTVGVGAGAVKELRDRRRGGGSWRDFAWTAGGTATGTFIAWIVDKESD